MQNRHSYPLLSTHLIADYLHFASTPLAPIFHLSALRPLHLKRDFPRPQTLPSLRDVLLLSKL
jgi:hypothetical protein